jgi:hypothetical protein
MRANRCRRRDTEFGEYALGRLLQSAVDAGVKHPGFRGFVAQATLLAEWLMPGAKRF